jgi:serine phosphatase RsbU (regulator of sigma subunit)
MDATLSPAEADEILEPDWLESETRLTEITEEVTSTVDLLQKQLKALRQASADVVTTLDNARLNRLEAQSAAVLQRSMLPARAPRIPGVDIAYGYRPGEFEGGGDWYDALQLSGGRTAFAIGDVMGHGLLPAAAMGQLRTAILTMAVLDLPPAQILRHLDNLAHRLGPEYLATCLYAVYDPVARLLSVANAGAFPPVITHRNGVSEFVSIPVGAPIGVGGVPFAVTEIPVPDGSWVMLCTDTLVGMRDEGHLAIPEDFSKIVREYAEPKEVCSAMLNKLGSSHAQIDDIALLVARLDGIPQRDVAFWTLAMHPSEVRRSREIVRDQLRRWGLEPLTDVSELLVSELVTMALQSRSQHIELRMMLFGKVVIEITDDDYNLPKLEPVDVLDETGRELHLVSNLSRRWGTSRTAAGKVVWFELALPGNE